MFHDSRAWLDGNSHESEDSLHYLPVGVCSSVDLTGPSPVYKTTTPVQALASPLTEYAFGIFRHQGSGNGVPFYRQSADDYVLSKMPAFCMKPCAPPVVKTTETKLEPLKTIAPAGPAEGTAPAAPEATKATVE